MMKSCVILLCCLMVCAVPLVCAMPPQVLPQVNTNVIPYPNDCTKYQQCDNSGCFVMSCGIGTEFNPAILACDYPLRDRTDCSNRGNRG